MMLVPSNLTPAYRITCYAFAVISLFFVSASTHRVMAQEAKVGAPEAIENPFPKRNPSPELEGGVEWLEYSRAHFGQRSARQDRVDRLLDFLL